MEDIACDMVWTLEATPCIPLLLQELLSLQQARVALSASTSQIAHDHKMEFFYVVCSLCWPLALPAEHPLEILPRLNVSRSRGASKLVVVVDCSPHAAKLPQVTSLLLIALVGIC